MNNFDPQTGMPLNQQAVPPTAPIVGYDPQTGAPIYGNAPVNEAPVQPQYQQPVYTQPAQPQYQQPVYEQPMQPQYQQPAYEQPIQPEQTQFTQTPQFIGKTQEFMQQQQMEDSMNAGNEPKKSRTGLIVGLIIAAIVIVAIAIAAIIFIPKFFGNDKDKVVSAISKTFNNNTSNNDTLGMASITKKMEDTPYAVTMDFTLNELSGDLLYQNVDADMIALIEGIGFNDLTIASDMENNAYLISAGLNYAGVADLIDAEFIYNEDGISISSPTLFDGYINISPEDVAAMLDDEELQELLAELEGITASTKTTADQEKIYKDMEKLIKEFADSLEFEKSGSDSIEIDGKKSKCTVYDLTIPAKDTKKFAVKFMTLVGEYAGLPTEDISEDDFDEMPTIKMKFYVDKNDALVKYVLKDIKMDGFTFGADLEFLGSENPLDVIEGSFDISIEDYITLSIDVESVTERSGSETTTYTKISTFGSPIITLESYEDSKSGDFSLYADLLGQFVLNMEGSVTDVVKGESFTLNIDDFSVQSEALSFGISMRTGPGLPFFAITNAWRTVSARSFTSLTI